MAGSTLPVLTSSPHIRQSQMNQNENHSSHYHTSLILAILIANAFLIGMICLGFLYFLERNTRKLKKELAELRSSQDTNHDCDKEGLVNPDERPPNHAMFSIANVQQILEDDDINISDNPDRLIGTVTTAGYDQVKIPAYTKDGIRAREGLKKGESEGVIITGAPSVNGDHDLAIDNVSHDYDRGEEIIDPNSAYMELAEIIE